MRRKPKFPKPKFPPLAIDLDDLKVTCECGGEMVGVGTVACLDCDNTADEEAVLAFALQAGAFVGCPVYVSRPTVVAVAVEHE